jgi:phthalate 4,5-dioxygenase oxygenase subunit
MGPIADRTREHRGASDLAILQFRRQMIAAARRWAADGSVIGAHGARPRPVKLASFEGIVGKDTDWRTLGNAPVTAVS